MVIVTRRHLRHYDYDYAIRWRAIDTTLLLRHRDYYAERCDTLMATQLLRHYELPPGARSASVILVIVTRYYHCFTAAASLPF